MFISQLNNKAYESKEAYFKEICKYIVEKKLFSSGNKLSIHGCAEVFVPLSVFKKRGLSVEDFRAGRTINLQSYKSIFIIIKEVLNDYIFCTLEDRKDKISSTEY